MPQKTWSHIQKEAKQLVDSEPSLVSLVHETIINQVDFGHCLAFHLANKFSDACMNAVSYNHLLLGLIKENDSIVESAIADLKAIKERDPACECYTVPLLYFKGFLAIQAARIAKVLWNQNRKVMALHIQSRSSELFGTDIHPAATMGKGLFLDHATGFVVGETAVIGNNVSILHAVTLGGSGKESGDRHPKVGDGVLIGAGAKLLGNINISEGAKIGAGSVVLEDVPAHTTFVGNPAKAVGKTSHKFPARFMEHNIDHPDYEI